MVSLIKRKRTGALIVRKTRQLGRPRSPANRFRSQHHNLFFYIYIGYRFPLSLSTIWRNHLPFNQFLALQKQTPHFDTRSEINPSRTLVKNEIMKTFKSAQNIGNRARKCIWHCFSCEMGYLSTRLQSFTRLKARERFRRLVLR